MAKNAIQPNSKVTVKIPWSEVQPVYSKVLQKAATRIKVDGFRIGKVPPHIAEPMLKKDALFEEVINQILPAKYNQALQVSKKLPISRPEVQPIQLEKDQEWVFDIFFAEQQPVTLSNYQDQVKKARKEAEKEIAEKAADLVKQAKKASAELTTHQKEDIQLKYIFKFLVEAINPKVQEILIHAEVNRELQRLVDQLGQLNLKVEDYLRSRKVTAEQLQQEYAAGALTSLQIEFILAEIAKAQKLTVTDTEVDKMLEQVGNGKLTATQRQDHEYRSYIFSNLLKQKVITFLLSL